MQAKEIEELRLHRYDSYDDIWEFFFCAFILRAICRWIGTERWQEEELFFSKKVYSPKREQVKNIREIKKR